MIDEGYIKFNINLIRKKSIQKKEYNIINFYRNELYHKNLIGAYDNGIGFGNISIKRNNGFIISGSGTGNKNSLTQDDYSEVIDYNFFNNYIECKGQIEASSESLSHAIVYESSSLIQAVVHIHSINLWNKYLNILPTTNMSAKYGTVEMAFELKRLLNSSKSNLLPTSILDNQNNTTLLLNCIVMGGHKEGLIFWGSNLNEIMKNIKIL